MVGVTLGSLVDMLMAYLTVEPASSAAKLTSWPLTAGNQVEPLSLDT